MSDDVVLATIGKIDNGFVCGYRDAVHFAVVNVTAGERLRRGDRIVITNNNVAFKEGSPNTPSDRTTRAHAIVDPFLEVDSVNFTEDFWAFILPRTITGLRHVWSHPDLPDIAATPTSSGETVMSEVDRSRMWLAAFADDVGLSYDSLMKGTNDWVTYGEYMNYGSLLEGKSVPDEFWVHYQRVTGKSVAEDMQGTFFSCSC